MPAPGSDPANERVSRIASVSAVVPPYHYPQETITTMFADLCGLTGRQRAVMERFHSARGVATRHLALPLDRYAELDGFGAANDVFIASALDLGERAIRQALDEAGLRPADVDLIVSTSVTGLATPSIDALLVDRIGLRPDVKRVPIFGLGCVAGAAGIARLHDYLLAWPDQVAVLLSVELCSLTVQRDDASVPNLVASGLFGDGASAVVAVGARRRDVSVGGPSVRATRSRMYPDTRDVMGWGIGAEGFHVVLAASVADVVETHLADDVERFLDGHGLSLDSVDSWVSHPGGPKVIEAIQRTLKLPPEALELTWNSLRSVGNLSSSSVLHVLRDTIVQRRPDPDTTGLLLAMGPGFCSELVLLDW